MTKISELKPERVFYYFEEMSRIPRGSGDMVKIADFCVDFAKKIGLEYVRDKANNVVIYKPASKGYENAEPVILQGHLDMVCQKAEGSQKNFSTDGIDLVVDGAFLKADGTTLGGDNGSAVAMAMAILEDNTLSHPSIEAVFTFDSYNREILTCHNFICICLGNLESHSIIRLEHLRILTHLIGSLKHYRCSVPILANGKTIHTVNKIYRIDTS